MINVRSVYQLSFMNTSPPAIGAISAGIRYQIRFFWWQALPMLYSGGVAKVVLEHRGIVLCSHKVVLNAGRILQDCLNDETAHIGRTFAQFSCRA